MYNPLCRWNAFELARLLPKNSLIGDISIRAFCTFALPDNRGKVVEEPQRRRRGPDIFAEPVLERLLLGRPRRERAVRESVRQQVKGGGDNDM